MTAAELASDLEARADFVDRDRYDECMEIKETPEGRLLRQAAARLRSMEEALKPIHEIWSGAEDDCDNGGYVEEHIRERVAVFTENNSKNLDRHLLCDLVEKLGRKARAALSGEGQ